MDSLAREGAAIYSHLNQLVEAFWIYLAQEVIYHLICLFGDVGLVRDSVQQGWILEEIGWILGIGNLAIMKFAVRLDGRADLCASIRGGQNEMSECARSCVSVRPPVHSVWVPTDQGNETPPRRCSRHPKRDSQCHRPDIHQSHLCTDTFIKTVYSLVPADHALPRPGCPGSPTMRSRLLAHILHPL